MKTINKLWRKAISLILTFALVMSSMPTGAFAQSVDTEVNTVKFFISYDAGQQVQPVEALEQKLNIGESAAKPEIAYEGYTMSEWFILADDGTLSDVEYDFALPVVQDISLVSFLTVIELDEVIDEATDENPDEAPDENQDEAIDENPDEAPNENTDLELDVAPDENPDEELDEAANIDNSQNELNRWWDTTLEKPNGKEHLLFAISTDNQVQPGEPGIYNGNYNYFFRQTNKWISGNDWTSGSSYCGNGDGSHKNCFTANASEVLNGSIYNQLSYHTSGSNGLWGYTNSSGINSFLNESFVSGMEKEMLKAYVSKNMPAGSNPEEYKIVWYVAKYQGNDKIWHVDGTVVEKAKFAVSYNINGGTGALPDGAINIVAGSSYSVKNSPNDNLSKDGYIFTGWNTKADGKGTHYNVSDSFIVTSNVTLYADWKVNLSQTTVTVNLYSAPSGQANKDKLIRTETRNMQGYKLSEWMNSENGKKADLALKHFWPEYNVGESNMHGEFEWTPAQYSYNVTEYTLNLYIKDSSEDIHTITFVNDSVMGVMEPAKAEFAALTGTAWNNAGIAVPTITANDGFAFLGWREGASGKLLMANDIESLNTYITETHIYTAVYEGTVEYANISFTAGEGGTLDVTGSKNDVFNFDKAVIGESFGNNNITIPAPIPDDGYYFNGWTPTEPTSETAVTGETQYTASFAKKTELSIKANGGSFSYDKTEKSVSGFTVSDSTLIFKDVNGNALTSFASGTNAGTYTSAFNSEASDVRVYQNGVDVTYRYNIKLTSGSLVIDKLAVTLTSGTESFIYDASAHTHNSVAVSTALPEGVSFTYSNFATVGPNATQASVENTFSYAINGDVPENYKIAQVFGALSITKREITVTTGSYNGMYDGKVHSEKSINANLPEGFTISAAKFPEITNAGNVINAPEGLVIKNAVFSGNLAANFEIKAAYGTLTVLPREIIITADTKVQPYNGEELKGSYTITGDGFVKGEGVSAVVSGAVQSIGSVNTEITSYAFNEGTLEQNYSVKTVAGTLTISKNDATALTIKANDKTADYNGKEQFADDGAFTIVSGSLMQNHTIEVEFTGSRLNAGTADLIPTGFTVKDENGKNVTSDYTITPSNGTLTINKLNVTIAVEDKEKPYDGTPLNGEDTNVTVDGFIDGEGVLITVTGSATTESGKTSTSFTAQDGTNLENYIIDVTEGSLTITQNIENERNTITVTAQSKSFEYDGTAKTLNGINALQGKLYEGDKAVAYVSGSAVNVRDAGVNKVTSIKIMHGDADVSKFYNLKAESGKITITPRSVTVTSASARRVYNGKPLTSSNYSITSGSFVNASDARVSVTGTITLAGNALNTFEISFKSLEMAENYKIVKKSGTLIVDKISHPLVVTAGSDDKMYDGTPLAWNEFSYTDKILVNGDKVEATLGGSITNVSEGTPGKDGDLTYGEISNRVEGVKIVSNTLGDVTSCYTMGEHLSGILRLYERRVQLTAASAEKQYDGIPLTSGGFTAENALEGEKFSVVTSGAVETVGTAQNVIESWSVNGEASNYCVLTVPGKLSITNESPIGFIVNGLSKTKPYDGVPITVSGNEATMAGILAVNDEIEISASAEITNYTLGGVSYTPSVTIWHTNADKSKTDVTAYYNLSVINGLLNITKRNVEITANGGAKVYDGTANLTQAQKGYTISALDEANGFITGEGIESVSFANGVLIGSGAAEITGHVLNEGTNPSNYNVTYKKGAIEVTPYSGLVTISSASADKMYDGTPLTANGYEAEGLLSADTASVSVTGSAANVFESAKGNNSIAGYTIMNGNENVTAYYSNVNKANGTLNVMPREISINGATKSQSFNPSNALNANNEYTISGNGFAEDEGLASVSVTGSILNPGITASVVEKYELNSNTDVRNYIIKVVNGTLTVNKTDAIPLQININDVTAKYNGTEHSAGNAVFTVDGEAGTARVEVTFEGIASRTDAGETVLVPVVKVFNGTTEITENFELNFNTPKLIVEKRNVTITPVEAAKAYDGTALTATDYTVSGDGFVNEDGLSEVVYSGSVIAGEGKSGIFSYELNAAASRSNYNVTTGNASLSVTKNNSLKAFVTSSSQRKVYDGKALSANEIFITGAQTDTATADFTSNVINVTDTKEGNNSYENVRIMNGEIDVTAYYGEISAEYGTLTILPKALTLSSQSFSKEYDGTPLKNTGGAKAEGYVNDEKLIYAFTAEQINAGETDNVFTAANSANALASNYAIDFSYGTLEVTPVKKAIKISAASGNKIYDGTALINNGYTYTQGVLKNGDKLSAVVEGSVTNVSEGRKQNIVSSYSVVNASGEDVTSSYIFSTSVTGELFITPASVQITAGSANREYNGEALTNNSYTATGFIGNDNVENVVVNGTIELPGKAENIISSYLFKGSDKANYKITAIDGILEITHTAANKVNLAVNAISKTKVYDGTPLTAQAVHAAGKLYLNDSIIVEAEGVASDYTQGGVKTTATARVIHTFANGSTQDVTNLYTIDITNGLLIINKRNVEITANGGAKAYDGTPLTAESKGYTVTAFDSNTAGNGFISGEGIESAALSGEITYGNAIEAVVKSHTLANGTKARNYNISYKNGTLVITNNVEDRMAVTVTAASAERIYNGTAFENAGYNAVSGQNSTQLMLHTGDVLSARVEGSVTNVFENSSSNNKITSVKIMHGEGASAVDVSEYYNIEAHSGTLEITPKAISITGNNASYLVDGTTRTVTGAAIAGIADGFTASIPTASVSRAAVGTSYMGLTASTELNVTSNETGLAYEGLQANLYAKNYVAASVVDGSLTIVAAPEPIVPPTTPEAPVPPIVPPAAPVPPAVVEPVPDAPEVEIEEEDAPLADTPQEEIIEEEQAPLAGFASWALFNLLLAIATVFGSLLLLITYFTRKKREEEEKAENLSDEEKAAVKRRGAMRILSLIPSFASVIAFILTQNMKNPMILVDKWTILMAVIAVVQIIVMLLAKKKIENDEKNDQKA